MTKHHKVDHLTELKTGDFVLVKGQWAEIYHITQDDGINTSRGWVCRTELSANWQVSKLDPNKPIVFLDIDGVLNSANYFKTREKDENLSRDENQIDPQAVGFLNEISDWNFVLSSTWRRFKTLEQINTLLKSRGFLGEVFSFTPKLDSPNLRGNEILQWIQDNIEGEFDNYIIFDDDSDMLYWQRNNFLHVDGYWGIGPNHVYRAKRICKENTREETIFKNLTTPNS